MGKNPLSRWYRWKYSGIITVGGMGVMILVGLQVLDNQGEFYDKWNCELLIDYRDKEMKSVNILQYNELTIEEQNRYDDIIKRDCSLFKP